MLSLLHQRKIARVLFDESHGEAWSIRPDIAAAIQPEHAAGSSYALAAAALAGRDFEVSAATAGPLSAAALAAADVLVIAHPSEPRWERTVGGSPLLRPDEIDAIEEFVAGGGGLVVLGETEEDKYGANLNELLARFGAGIDNVTVEDHERHNGAPTWVFAEPVAGADELGHAAPRQDRLPVPRRCAARARRRGGAALRRRGSPRRRSRARRPASRRRPGGRDRRLRPVRRRRARRVRPPAALVEPALLGRPAGLSRRARAARVGRPGRRRLGAPARRDRRAAPAAGAARRSRHGAPRARRGPRPRRGHDRGDRQARRLLSPRAGLPGPGRPRPAALARRGLRQARLRRVARAVSPRAGPQRRHGAPRGVPALHAQQLARHSLRGAAGAHALARLHRPARARRLRQRQVRAGAARRPHPGLRRRLRRAVP